MTSKWQYKIRNRKMVYEFESDVKIDDEILKAELGEQRGVSVEKTLCVLFRRSRMPLSAIPVTGFWAQQEAELVWALPSDCLSFVS